MSTHRGFRLLPLHIVSLDCNLPYKKPEESRKSSIKYLYLLLYIVFRISTRIFLWIFRELQRILVYPFLWCNAVVSYIHWNSNHHWISRIRYIPWTIEYAPHRHRVRRLIIIDKTICIVIYRRWDESDWMHWDPAWSSFIDATTRHPLLIEKESTIKTPINTISSWAPPPSRERRYTSR